MISVMTTRTKLTVAIVAICFIVSAVLLHGQATYVTGATGTFITNAATRLRMTATNLLGRTSAGTGPIQEIAIGSGLVMTNQTLAATGGGGSTGTVTSVSLTMPGGFSVGGSPVTGSGTLAVTMTNTGILKGTGSGVSNAVVDVDYIAPGSVAGGSLSGTYPNPSLAASGVTNGVYGSATMIPQLSVGTNGLVTGATNVTINVPSPAFETLTDAATITWAFTSPQMIGNAMVTLGGNRTLSITGATSGSSGTLVVTQDGTGSRTLALPAGSKVIGGAGGVATLSTPTNSIDILSFIYNGTNFFWTVGHNYN